MIAIDINTCISGRIFFSNDKLKILMFNNIRHYLQGQMFLLFAFTIVNTPIILPTFFNWRITAVYIRKAFLLRTLYQRLRYTKAI